MDERELSEIEARAKAATDWHDCPFAKGAVPKLVAEVRRLRAVGARLLEAFATGVGNYSHEQETVAREAYEAFRAPGWWEKKP